MGDEEGSSKRESSRRVSFNKTVFSMDDSGKKGEEEMMLSDEEEEEEEARPSQNGRLRGDEDTDSSDDSDYDEDVLESSEKGKRKKPLNKTSVNKDGFEIVSAKKPGKFKSYHSV